MPDLVRIPLAVTEYHAHFDRPCIGLIGNDRQRVVEAMVNALLPFGFRLSNSEATVAGNLAEYKLTFKLPERGITMSIGAEEFKFTKENSNWGTAEEDVQILVAAEQTMLEGSSAKIGFCLVTVAMHLQLLSRPREAVLEPFIPGPFLDWGNRELLTYGNHLKWLDGDLLLDFSAAYANGIFLRYSTRFDGHPPAVEMLQRVQEEEIAIFKLLGVQGNDDVE